MKRLADFAAGDTFQAVREVDPYRPIYYAGASGDFNPIHIDPRVGRAAGFQGAILQGMCTYAWAAEACVAYLDDPARLARLRVRFSRPLQVGDAVTIEGRCTAIEGGAVRVELSARNQRGEDVLKGAAAEGWLAGGVPPPSPLEAERGAPRSEPVPAIDRGNLGRRYGPFTFAVGREDVRDFVAAIGGGVPGHVFSAPPDHAHPLSWDEATAAAGPHGGLVAPPAFAAVYAVEPFARAISDPALALDLLRLVHGEQELEFLEPVRPGDVLTTTGEVTRIDVRGSLDVVDVTTETVNQHGRTVTRGVWTAAVRR